MKLKNLLTGIFLAGSSLVYGQNSNDNSKKISDLYGKKGERIIYKDYSQIPWEQIDSNKINCKFFIDANEDCAENNKLKIENKIAFADTVFSEAEKLGYKIEDIKNLETKEAVNLAVDIVASRYEYDYDWFLPKMHLESKGYDLFIEHSKSKEDLESNKEHLLQSEEYFLFKDISKSKLPEKEYLEYLRFKLDEEYFQSIKDFELSEEYLRLKKSYPENHDFHFFRKLGLCRHYVASFTEVFDLIKKENKNLNNVYAGNNGDLGHAWNRLVFLTKDSMFLSDVDLTLYDGLREIEASAFNLYFSFYSKGFGKKGVETTFFFNDIQRQFERGDTLEYRLIYDANRKDLIKEMEEISKKENREFCEKMLTHYNNFFHVDDEDTLNIEYDKINKEDFKEIGKREYETYKEEIKNFYNNLNEIPRGKRDLFEKAYARLELLDGLTYLGCKFGDLSLAYDLEELLQKTNIPKKESYLEDVSSTIKIYSK